MPYTVAVSFDKFRENIELSGDHRETATARKDEIISLLKNDFEILEAFATGSIPRFTAVRGHADLDVMVALHYSKHIKDKKPSEVLQAVRDALEKEDVLDEDQISQRLEKLRCDTLRTELGGACLL